MLVNIEIQRGKYLCREGGCVTAYRGLDMLHHRKVTSCSLSLKLQVTTLLYEKWAVPALECDCKKSDRVFHVSNHLLYLLICIDGYQMHIRVLECKNPKYLVGKRLPDRIHIFEIKNNLPESFETG